MRIIVNAGSWARRWLPEGLAELELPEGSFVEDVLAPLGIPPEEIGLFSVNGKAVQKEAALSGGNTVRIFPVIMGG